MKVLISNRIHFSWMVLAFMAWVAVHVGCGADTPDTAEELDVVATTNDPNFRFNSVTTFAMPNAVLIVSGSPTPNPSPSISPSPSPSTVNSATSNFILQQVADQMTQRGFVRLTDPSGPKPDLFMEVSAMQTTNTQVYYDYWYPYWGAYYAPWYGSSFSVGWSPTTVPYVTSVTTGTLWLNLTVPNQANSSTQEIPSVWLSAINGVLDDTSVNLNQRIQTGIDQAFSQSPYLSRTAP